MSRTGWAENPRATSLFPPRAPSRPEQLERLRFLDKPSNQSNNVDKASFSIPTYTVSEGYTVISTRPSVHPLTSPLTHQHYLIFLLFVISTSALANESGNPTYADSRMGFFSSRKAEDNDNYQVSIGVTATAGASGSKEDKSVVRVIRSRFYNKKGKDREDALLYQNASPAPPSNPSNPVASSPLSGRPSKRNNINGGRANLPGPGILRNHNTNDLNNHASTSGSFKVGSSIPSMPNHPYAIAEAQEASTSSTNVSLKPLPITPPRVGSLRAKPPLSVKTHTTPVGSTRSKASPHVKQTSASSSDVSPRKDTDTVTVTLAQRLNELAIANSEGLLNDDEYRLLRQNLFERFSTNTDIPLETPVVPLTPAQPRPPKAGGTSDRPNSRPLSNFHVERPMSIMSKTSTASGMTGLFRRVTDRRSVSKDMSDTSSVWSGKSSGNSIFRMPKMLSKKSSDSSVNTTASRNQADTMSISSKRSHHGEGNGSLYPTTPRSAAGSIRRMAYAPSAFNAKVIAQEKERNAAIYDVFDEDHLSTVKDIQQEILNIEAEAKRLMDAFSGLEVTTLAKNQRHRARRVEYGGSHGHGGAGSGGRSTGAASESMWGDSDGKSQRRMILGDSDAVSMKSGVSIGTNAPSLAARSTYSFGSRRVKGTLPSPMAASPLTPSSLHRKGSIASASDRDKEERTGVKVRPLPPVPALPTGISNGHLKAASTSNISLINKSNSHLPMNTVPEDDKSMAASTVNTTNTVHGEEVEEAETDLEDIRRRREEVSHRYEARLEFLRAKLKGAQLHEKLMRK